jgi:hypothetical protein
MRRLLPLLLLTVVGCAAFQSDFDPFESASDRGLNVRVSNESYSTVSITALAAGRRTLLGRAEGNTRVAFSVPWSGEGEVRFLLEILGGQRYTTAPVLMVPGRQLEILIREPLQRSVVRR